MIFKSWFGIRTWITKSEPRYGFGPETILNRKIVPTDSDRFQGLSKKKNLQYLQKSYPVKLYLVKGVPIKIVYNKTIV